MIRTLVVDDDYRVAKVHAAGVNQIDGFVCVGEAHSSAEARELVGQLGPDLLLVDLYLPDENGLDLVRSLDHVRAPHEDGSLVRPDFIAITAARDVASVRRAMQLGAVYYLVKPFGYAQLKDKLVSYQRLRAGLGEAEVADQQTVDQLYGLLRAATTGSPGSLGRPGLSSTAEKVLAMVRVSPKPLTAADVALSLGFSRATAQRYLADLVRRGLLEVSASYGGPGRPEHRFRIRH